MKRFAAIVTAGLVATTLFTTYVVARPQRILGIEYKIETPATVENVVLDSSQIYYLSQLLYGEARNVQSTTEKAAVCWVVLNRVDNPNFPNSISGVLTQPNQFNGYSSNNPIDTELQEIATDVLKRWYLEHSEATEVGRVIPQDYLYFSGDGSRNYFRQTLSGSAWDWSLESPYAD